MTDGVRRLSWVPILGCSFLFFCACGEDSADGKAEVLGKATKDIDLHHSIVRTQECGMGNLLAELMLAGVAEAGAEAEIAFMNGGGIRGDAVMPAGDITSKMIDDMLPFSNDHEVVKVTGTQLKSILERSVASLPVDPSGEERSGWFLHPTGVSYTVTCANQNQRLNALKDAIETEGQRITKIAIGATVIYDPSTSTDALSTTSIKVAAPGFIARGEDKHLAFTLSPEPDHQKYPIETFNLVTAMKNYVKAHSPIDPPKKNLMTVVGDCAREVQ